MKARHHLALACLFLSLLFLTAGITLPVITISGALRSGGLVDLVLEAVNDRAPGGKPVDPASPLEQMRVSIILMGKMNEPNTPEAELLKRYVSGLIGGIVPPAGPPRVIYTQTRSIVSSVVTLYKNQAGFAATLILLFSVCVPIGKAAVVLRAIMHARGARRERYLKAVDLIGKWSMADVFAVAIFIVYLAAKASEGTTQAVAFYSTFGPGFYFFASYCLVALVGQQITRSLLRADDPLPHGPLRVGWEAAFATITALSTVIVFTYAFGEQPNQPWYQPPINWVHDHGIAFTVFVAGLITGTFLLLRERPQKPG